MKIKTEDGVMLEPGDRAFNYYDMKLGYIHPTREMTDYTAAGHETNPNQDLWFDFMHDEGGVAILNGQRICSIRFAERKGWI